MNQILTKPILLTDPVEIIIKGCRENHLLAQEQLYKHCYPDMIKICYRYAGDMDGAGIIFNNAMLRVFKGIRNYQHEGKFMAWVKVIVVNCCLDFIKKENRFREQQLTSSQEEQISIAEEVFGKVSIKEIQKIINQLPKATAAVFNLFVYEGFTHKQVAGSLGISEGTSKWHVNEGRKIMKSKLEHLFNPESKK
jgi:RNA polymerase sigma-70 factor (ECF subfamily)